MNIKRKYKKSLPRAQHFVVLNQDGEVFSGLSKGHPVWSFDWSEAKPLLRHSTNWLLANVKGTEIIKEEELLK